MSFNVSRRIFVYTVYMAGEKLIQEKDAFTLWVELGSLVRATTFFNRENGLDITIQGFQYARDLYIVKHPQEAREKAVPRMVSEEKWEIFLIRRAMNVYRRSTATGTKTAPAFHRFVKNYGLQKYSYLYADQFGFRP